MEYREWQRRLIPFEVEVRLWHRQGEQIIKCKTRNISMNGAFLITDQLGFPRYRMLELRFAAMDRLKLPQTHIIAKAIRQEKDGLAVRFTKADRESIRALHKILQWRSYFPVGHKQRRYLNPTSNAD